MADEHPWKAPSQAHLWRPYAQMQLLPPPVKAVRTEGCRIHLDDGRVLIDGIASWWTAAHGYNHPHILAAMHKQLDTMPHVMFGGLTHDPAIILSQKLVKIAPRGLNRVFFTDSGSVSVEVSMKMALQYWQNVGQPNKNKFICFRGSYHGDTFGAMAVSDPEDSMHKAFKSTVSHQYVLDIPTSEYSFAEFEDTLQAIAKNVAGIIVEPLVQAAEGMRFYSADTLEAIHRVAKANNILFIADEIATGFGRTGSLFACNEAGITPDIMCLGKALTGGCITLAATMTTEAIFEAFLADTQDKAFMHGPTYMANPLACSAAIASLELFEQEDRIAEAEGIETQLREQLFPLRFTSGIRDVRIKGAIGVVELDAETIDKVRFNQRFVELGVWIRPIKNVLYLMPSLTISTEELSLLTGAIKTVVEEWSRSRN